MVTRPYIGKSEAQANAEAIARRDANYLGDHYASKRPRPRPRGLMELLSWFEQEWYAQAPDELHKRELWRDYVSANEQWARAGGGSVLGTHAWSEAMRRLLEAPFSADQDGYYVHPLAAAMARIERRDGYMAAFLRAIALAGFEISPVGFRCGLPESVTMVYALAALDALQRAYRDEVPARVLAPSATMRPIDELSPPDIAGPTVSVSTVTRIVLAAATPE
jgi:hypothetical protein